MKNEALFRTGSVWKSIFSMAVPSIIIILVMVLYNMADMFFVGCLGDPAQVAAVSVVGPVFSILAAVATMLGAGSSAVIARCFGAGEIEQGKICSSLCVWTSFFLGVLVSIGLLVGRVPLLGVLGSNAEFFPYAERRTRRKHSYWRRPLQSMNRHWSVWDVRLPDIIWKKQRTSA